MEFQEDDRARGLKDLRDAMAGSIVLLANLISTGSLYSVSHKNACSGSSGIRQLTYKELLQIQQAEHKVTCNSSSQAPTSGSISQGSISSPRFPLLRLPLPRFPSGGGINGLILSVLHTQSAQS